MPDERHASEKVMELLNAHAAKAVLAWDFQYIPVAGLEQSLREAGIEIHLPDIHQDERQDNLSKLAEVPVGLTGADAAAATTATLIVSTGPGKGRIPTVLPPIHMVILRQDQIVPRLEDWVAAQQARRSRRHQRRFQPLLYLRSQPHGGHRKESGTGDARARPASGDCHHQLTQCSMVCCRGDTCIARTEAQSATISSRPCSKSSR